MYTAVQYRTDLAKTWSPTGKAWGRFGKSLLTLDPFNAFGYCFLAVALSFFSSLIATCLTVRRLLSR